MRPRFALLFASTCLLTACRPPSDTDATAQAPEAGAAAEHEQPSEPEAQTPADRPEGSIYRSELVRATQNGTPAYLLGQLAPEPYRPQGRFEGWVITRVWPGDPDLCQPGCDLYPGDVILSVNGSRLETPEALSAMLERLIEFESIDVSGIRNGEFFERSYPILSDPEPTP